MARSKKMSLSEAKRVAHTRFHLGSDYHALSSSDRLRLNSFMKQTQWRQSPSAAAKGRSRAYSFWLALGGS